MRESAVSRGSGQRGQQVQEARPLTGACSRPLGTASRPGALPGAPRAWPPLRRTAWLVGAGNVVSRCGKRGQQVWNNTDTTSVPKEFLILPDLPDLPDLPEKGRGKSRSGALAADAARRSYHPGRQSGSGWAAVESATAARIEQKKQAENDACDEVFGPGELAKRRRPRREQVRRAVDKAEAAVRTTRPRSFAHPGYHVPAFSDETWDVFVDGETDPFLKSMWREVRERYHRRASFDTPYDQRYSADDRRQSEQAHLDDAITQTYRRELQTWRSSPAESQSGDVLRRLRRRTVRAMPREAVDPVR